MKFVAAYFREYDAIVGTSGRVDYTTLQAADDALDAAAYSLFVKQGTYAAGLTVSTNNVYIFVEPGTVIEAAITLSGDNVTLVLGAGCDVQGKITLSGVNCSLLCQNGCDIDGVLLSGNLGFYDGGGLDTITIVTSGIALEIQGDDCIAKNSSAHTDPAGSASDAVATSAGGPVRATFKNIKVIDSKARGFHVRAANSLVEGCTVLGADEDGMRADAVQIRFVNNFITTVAGDGINIAASGDGAVMTANIIKDHGAQGIDIHVNAEDCVVVGNKVDDLGTGNGVVDNSCTSTVASNEETAF
jgi:hypothetical protein